MRIFLLACLILAGCTAQTAQPPSRQRPDADALPVPVVKSDLELLQGKWVRYWPSQDLYKTALCETWEFAGDTVTITDERFHSFPPAVYQFAVNQQALPKRMDLTGYGTTMLCIYDVDGASLRLDCHANHRPILFQTPAFARKL